MFNILFVVGACGLVAPEPLALSWWPLFRDCSFYAFALALLWIVFVDGVVQVYEALVLFLVYIGYCVFMAKSEQVEAWTEAWLERRRQGAASSEDESCGAGGIGIRSSG